MRKINGNQAEKGFTLVELIIVLAILAIITAIVVPRYINFLSDAEEKAVASDKAMIEKAVELCLTADPNGKNLLTAYGTEKAIEATEPLIPKYLKTIPLDPSKKVYKLKITEKDNNGYDIIVSQQQ